MSEALQSAGCVFLPAAGYRLGDSGNTSVDDVGNYGYYWSASSSGRDSAFDLLFRSGRFNPYHFDTRDQAYAVRLVTKSN